MPPNTAMESWAFIHLVTEGSMKKVLYGFAIAMVGCLIGGLFTEAHAQVLPPATPVTPTAPDVVTLKNGSSDKSTYNPP
jgi:hypothetical protein